MFMRILKNDKSHLQQPEQQTQEQTKPIEKPNLSLSDNLVKLAIKKTVPKFQQTPK